MEEKKKRIDSVVAVTVAKYATMYVEAETPEEAVKYAKEHCDEVDSWISRTESAWTRGKPLPHK